MDLRLVPRVLLLRAAWHPRDHWDAARISKHQQHALRELRNAAYAGSAFYRRHHAGLLGAPLDQLPPVTKEELMANFNDALTVRGPTLEHLEHHLRSLAQGGGDPGIPWQGRWWPTAGTTGRRGTFLWNGTEWATVLGSYARAYDWAGITASGLSALAAEQHSRRLRICPQAVMSASEVLTPQAAAQLTTAWGTAPSDIYAATETAGIASPCRYRNRHLYEDLLFVEAVGQDGVAVPQGTMGAKLLVSVLFSRTLPRIRYGISDSIRLGGRGCPCGRSFALLESIEGRQEDILHLPGRHGTVTLGKAPFVRVRAASRDRP